jgi:hypothetical protein
MLDVRKFHFEQLNRNPQPPVGERWEINKGVYWYFLESFCPPLGWAETPTGASFEFIPICNLTRCCHTEP